MKTKITYDLKRLETLRRKSPNLFKKSMAKAAIQFLTWANDGSPRESRKPPIKWGVLRGSGSAFVEDELVGTTPETAGSTALKSYSSKKSTMTWVWNTPYAARMHEHQGNWGEHTLNDNNAGNKWLELHLKADRKALIEVITDEFKNEITKFSTR